VVSPARLSGPPLLPIPVIQLLQVLTVALGAPGVTGVIGVIAKAEARLQGRRGPRVPQPYYDLAKLFRKEALAPAGASWFFLAAPLIAVTSLPDHPAADPGPDQLRVAAGDRAVIDGDAVIHELILPAPAGRRFRFEVAPGQFCQGQYVRRGQHDGTGSS